jgi:hypothetical protein
VTEEAEVVNDGEGGREGINVPLMAQAAGDGDGGTGSCALHKSPHAASLDKSLLLYLKLSQSYHGRSRVVVGAE